MAMRKSLRSIAGRAAPTGLPDAATAYALTMKAAAGEVAASSSVTAAALATASMFATCGTCHRAVGTMPALPVPTRPAVGGAVGHMLEHQRALDQMLQGLVIPSTESWQQGARALATAPLHVSELPRDPKLTPAFTRVEGDVHRLAADAIAATGTEARSRIYGSLMGKCAECHGLHRRIWGPGKK